MPKIEYDQSLGLLKKTASISQDFAELLEANSDGGEFVINMTAGSIARQLEEINSVLAEVKELGIDI